VPDLVAYDYALVRAVYVPTGDAQTLGVVLSCRQRRFLDCALLPPDACRLQGVDAGLLGRALAALERVVRGGPDAAPIGLLPPSERFHWLTAARSSTLQPSAVRTGVTDDPAAELARIAGAIGLKR
jgi:hypothetical protein